MPTGGFQQFLRAAHPGLPHVPVSRRALVALSHRIEEVVATGGSETLLVTGFQRAERWEAQRRRYSTLNECAEVVALYAADPVGPVPETAAGGPIVLPAGHPFAAEWFLVACGPDVGIVLSAYEEESEPGSGLPYTLVLSTTAEVTRAATGFLAEALRGHGERADAIARWERLPGPDTSRAHGDLLISRLIEDLDGLGSREHAAGRAAQRLHEQALLAHDSERRDLAEQLHDHSLQLLLAASQDLTELAEAGAEHDLLRSARENLLSGISDLRAALSTIHQPAPDSADLLTEIDSIGAALSRRGGFELAIDIDPTAVHLRDRELITLARELLTNTAKHANATTAALRITADPTSGAIALSVTDDGRGFDAAKLPDAYGEGHIGLALTRERIKRHRGAFTLTTAPGNGTRIDIHLPPP